MGRVGEGAMGRWGDRSPGLVGRGSRTGADIGEAGGGFRRRRVRG
jgi:hypothetical protein